MDNEDCFGFHSEYYVDPKWRKAGRDLYGERWRYFLRGYSAYSKYQDDIYFIADFDHENHAIYVIKANVKQKMSCAIKLDAKKSLSYSTYGTYMAVNRRGYFIYNTATITLFGFDGREIYTHKFGKKYASNRVYRTECAECVYIYDDKVIYSETKQTAGSTQIYCVNMLTQEKQLVWGSQKGDYTFDNHLRESFRQEWGIEWPFSKGPSEMGKVSCQFLCANKHRIIAGYTREYAKKEKTGYYTSSCNHYSVSYIVNIDLAEHKWSLLDCFVGLNSFTNENKDSLPSWDNRHIFSFNMLDDTMWVKVNGSENKLIHTDIQQVAQLRGKYPVDWKLCALADIKYSEAKYYHFDGRFACTSSASSELRFTPDGEWEKIDSHPYNDHSLRFWCFDGIYLVPNEYNTYYFRNAANGNIEYSLRRSSYDDGEITVEKLIQDAKQPQLEAAAESEKEELSGYTEPASSADEERKILEMAKETSDKIIAEKGVSLSPDEYNELVMYMVEEIRKILQEEPGKEPANNRQLSLATFRRDAPSMTGFREQLLSYRKSLPNNWDYNAFVGILLGVRGPKHGDAACMNFAIGQGDNGKNTWKTLEAKGLMSVFEKYQGKNIDETIQLSDVEDEIIAVAPEYAPIRQKLHEIMEG